MKLNNCGTPRFMVGLQLTRHESGPWDMSYLFFANDGKQERPRDVTQNDTLANCLQNLMLSFLLSLVSRRSHLEVSRGIPCN